MVSRFDDRAAVAAPPGRHYACSAMFRRRRAAAARPASGFDDVTAVVLHDDDPTASQSARSRDLSTLRRIAAEAVIVQDDAEQLLREIRERAPLAELAPRGGRLTSRFVALAAALPASCDPQVQRYAARMREVLDHHALMLSASLDLLAVAWRSDRLEEQVDQITGFGRPAQWLEDIRFELLIES
jgi:hypothetical protein